MKIGVTAMLAMVMVIGCCEEALRGAEAGGAASQPATTAKVQRVSLEEATKVVRAEIYRRQPQMNPAAKFPLKELTTDDVWKRLAVQVFVVTEGVQQCQTYIVRGAEATAIGASSGGWGVMSMCVADLDGDGKPELVFTHSSGSGVHRSNVGVWTGGATWINAETALRDDDLMVEKADDGHVKLAYGRFDGEGRKFSRTGDFGEVKFKEGKVEVVANEKLPAAEREKVWTPGK